VRIRSRAPPPACAPKALLQESDSAFLQLARTCSLALQERVGQGFRRRRGPPPCTHATHCALDAGSSSLFFLLRSSLFFLLRSPLQPRDSIGRRASHRHVMSAALDPPCWQEGASYAHLRRQWHSGPARSLLINVCVTLLISFFTYHSTSDVNAQARIAAATYTTTRSYDDQSFYMLGGTGLGADEGQWHFNPLCLNLAHLDFLLSLSRDPLEWAGKVRKEIVSSHLKG
jgi:hypothetical protein